MCVLDLNKVLMYEFHYENKYGNKSRLLFTETDSLMYEDFNVHEEMFDCNNYSVKSKYYDDLNKLLPLQSKMKLLVLLLKNLLN